MVKQVQDAKISVKLDVEGAQKQAKNLSRSIRQNRIDLGEAQKDSKEVSKKVAGKGTREKHWYSSDKTGYAGVKERAGKIRGKAVQFGYRGVRQAPDFTQSLLRVEAAAIEFVPYVGGPLSEGFKAAAPYAQLGTDISKAVLEEGTQGLEGTPGFADALAEVIEKVNLLDAQITATKELTAGVQGALSGGGDIVRAQLMSGQIQSSEFMGKVIGTAEGGIPQPGAEWTIAQGEHRLQEQITRRTRVHIMSNFGEFFKASLFGGK
jgi:hypothetical protein